jgi:hypothetical protein
MLKFIFCCLFNLILAFASHAQLFPRQDIPVIQDGTTLPNAWLGGLDLPQFSGGDINQDGREDLLIFDRKSNKILVLLKDINGNYKYAPDLEKFFPEIVRFALFRDYNCDGLMDIFAFVNTGIQVYRQELVGGQISFVQAKTLLEFDLGGFDVNIYNSNGDIPGIEDIDGDGDMDIAVFYSLGTSVPMYRNLSIENGFGCDSLIFEEYTSCWGLFSEGNASNNVNFDISCKGGTGTPIPSGGPKHVGSTILLFDPNEDNKMDILIGDVSYNSMVFLQNDNTNLNAHMASSLADYSYPSYDLPANVEIFPAAFYVDVTNDGKKDLLIAPNSNTAHVNTTSSWLYENTGNTTTPFSFVKNNFIIDEAMDFGSYSFPTFFDHNGDGLEDMIVANGYVYENMGTTIGNLYYFENTGVDTSAEFTLIDDDYLGLSNFGADFLRPTFGDLDDDGDKDLIFGDENGLVHYYENTAGFGNPAAFIQTQLQFFNIDVGNYAHPQLIDVNQDGLLDLLIGREGSYGEIAYFWNIGTVTNPVFSNDSSNQAFGKIRTNTPGFIPGYSAPTLLQTDSNQILFAGSEMGFIAGYLLNPDSLKAGSFALIVPKLFPSRVGLRTNLSIIDIDNDDVLEYFVGNARGGVSYFSSNQPADTTIIDTTGIRIRERMDDVLNFNIYPNPSSSLLYVSLLENVKDYSLQVFDVLGKAIYELEDLQIQAQAIDCSSWNTGVYYVKLLTREGRFKVKSFLKE